MRAIIVNLTRFGDLLQTQPVITGLAGAGYAVDVVCQQNFAAAAALLQGVGQAFPLPGARLLARVHDAWPSAVAEVEAFRARVCGAQSPGVVVNLTPSLSARLLAGILSGRYGAGRLGGGSAPVRGFGLDEHGFNADDSAWAAFLQCATAERGSSPFNVCDLFRRAAGLSGPGADLALREPGPEAAAAVAGRMAEAAAAGGGEGRSGFLALQMGASEDRRRWPVGRFAALAAGAWRRLGLVPVLLGSTSERPLAERFARQVEAGVPVVDLVGGTDLPELAAAVAACSAIVSNDTGTMHLAAGLGVPVVAVFLATAQPWDTGAYREGALSLEPDMDCHPCAFGATCPHDEACRQAIGADVVLDCLVARLADEEPGGLAGRGARAWRARRLDDGFLGLDSLSGHGDDPRSAWILVQREQYRRFLDGEPPAPVPRPTAALAAALGEALAPALERAAGLLELLVRQVELVARAPAGAVRSKFLASTQQVHTVLASEPRLSVLAALWRSESQRQGGDLGQLGVFLHRFLALVQSLRQAVRPSA